MTIGKEVPIPDWWMTREEDIQDYLSNKIKKGTTKILATSPGNRPVRVIYYGDAEPSLKGTANYNSSLGAGNPDAFYKRGPGMRKRPVVMVLAGVHGHEIEGVAAAMSVISLMETGKDLQGKEQPEFLEKLKKFRLIVVPLANPDGRVRVPYDGWIGLPGEEMTKYGQGTRKNGELYRWRGCKAVHPMQGDVGILGSYFDDAGINIMHDEWHSPMSKTTEAILEIAANEGPDTVINLHSCNYDPLFNPVHYIPFSAKKRLNDLVEKVFNDLKAAGLPFAKGQQSMLCEDGPEGTVPPALNLNSMLYHAGAELSFLFESPHGVKDNPTVYTYSDLLKINELIISTTCDYVLESLLVK